ncbi:MAG TPA: galactosyltransferase-related protein, partial [Pseudonocardiaceae bacterium]|nr:galactosyltransferase-related protein [Pseudonocardiaceae bacterium]
IVAADYWQHSSPFYYSVLAGIEAAIGSHPDATAAYLELIDRPTDTVTILRLQAWLAELINRNPNAFAAARQAADIADNNVYINDFRGADYWPAAPEVGPDRLRSLAEDLPPHTGGGDEVLVVIPFADPHGAGRLRNLLACLLALRDQTMPARHYRITVVEFDAFPRWREAIEPLVDDYVHIHGEGPFNKSWTLNVGVRATLGSARTLCLLDADILVDRDFLERNNARFADADNDAHLPHTEMLSLNKDASDYAIGQRCAAGAAIAPLTGLRGLLLRDVPGACLWVRPAIFHRIGGFDERYQGWGGEDEDMLFRTTSAGSVIQYDDVFVHMAHRRPPMHRADGRPFNGHIDVGSWTGEFGYGDPTGPATGPADGLTNAASANE